MLRFLGARVIYRGLRQSLRRGHTGFYFHPIDISTDPFPNIGNNRPLYWIVKGEIVERRIRHLLNRLSDLKWITLGAYHTEGMLEG